MFPKIVNEFKTVTMNHRHLITIGILFIAYEALKTPRIKDILLSYITTTRILRYISSLTFTVA